MSKCIIECFPALPLLMKAGSPFIFLLHTILDMVLPKVPFLLMLLNILSGTVYTNCCNIDVVHVLCSVLTAFLVSDWSPRVAPCAWPPLAVLRLCSDYRCPCVVPCVRGRTRSGLWAWYPLPLLGCLFGVSRMQPYTSLIFSTNNLGLNKPVTSH